MIWWCWASNGNTPTPTPTPAPTPTPTPTPTRTGTALQQHVGRPFADHERAVFSWSRLLRVLALVLALLVAVLLSWGTQC